MVTRSQAQHAVPHAPAMKQALLDMGLERLPGFDNFLATDEHNLLALRHLQLWTNRMERSALPTYLWGERGSGKTHLLRATAEALRGMGAQTGWLDSAMHDPPPFNPAWNVTILDDVHLYTAVQQQAAFHYFVQAQTEQRWILAAGDIAPASLKLREDLRTRFAWGHVFELRPVDESQRRAVLRMAADDRGIHLRDDVLDYILHRFSRDLGHLMELLENLDKYSLMTKRPVTTALVRKMMDDVDWNATSHMQQATLV